MSRWVMVGCVAGSVLLASASARVGATAPQAPAAQADSLKGINADHDKAVKALELARIERLAKLAATQPQDAANTTYEFLFQTAISSGLYVEVEATAEKVLKDKAKKPSPQVAWLAVFIDLLAKAKRGAYQDSLDTLVAAVHENDREPAQARLSVAIPESQRAGLIDAYFQILVQADQFDIARKAMSLIQEKTTSTRIRRMVGDRLKELDLVGKPAPPIVGKDLDGKPFNLADYRGQVVLLAFWASWSLPAAEELATFEKIFETYKGQGLKVVTVNVDAMQDGGIDPATVLPAIRRHALEKNVIWPVLVNQPGAANYAAAYGISEIPANVLISRDGKVTHLDLRRNNLEAKIAEELKHAGK